MKRHTKRLLSTFLMLAMLLSALAGTVASAEGDTDSEMAQSYKDIVNLWEFQGLGIPVGAAHEAFNGDTSYASSHLIPAKEGDVIYFGLMSLTQKWYIDSYRADGSRVSTVTMSDTAANFVAVVHEDLDGEYGILKWTVPAGKNIAQIRLTTKAKQQDVLVTKNQPFDYETMLKVMPLRNQYAIKTLNAAPNDTLDGADIALGGYHASEVIPVTTGDVLYFGMANLGQGWHLRAYNASGALAASLSKADIVVYDKISDSRGIIKWTVPANVTQLRLTTNATEYTMIVTKNQPFNTEIYEKIMSGSDAELAYATYAENLLTHPVVFQNEYIYAGVGLAGSRVDTAPDGTKGFYTSEAISVTAGDVVYVGMLDPTQGWNICGYRADGTSVTTYAGRTQIQNEPNTQFIHDSISNNRAIIKWTVPANVTSIRVTSWVSDYPILLTKNQPFDVAFYKTAFLPSNAYQPSSLGIPDVNNINSVLFENTGYAASEPIEVKAGDKIYFGPCSTSQKWFLASYTGTGGQATGSVNFANSVEYARISDTETIQCWTVPSGVTHVKMTVLGKYSRTAVLTVNQPFDKLTYNLYIADLVASNYGYGEVQEGSVLNGLNALFMGDSITAGSYDVMNPSQGKSWAGRIAASTGLNIENAGVGGAAIATRTNDTRWIFDQYTKNKGSAYDLVVMGGGVNDARSKLNIGQILETDDLSELEASVDLSTFAGGMQWLFANVRSNWANAKLFYVANFRLDGCTTGYAKDMSAYFAVAKELCERYGIVYIDLYNNTELNMLLQSVDTRYMPDLLHPTSDGYDLIVPYIQEVLEKEVRLQKMLTVNINVNEQRDLRLLTTVDSLNYASVGFLITRGTDGKVATVSSSTVYSSVLVDGDTREASEVSGYEFSEYISAIIITGVPSGMTVTVQAFVKTLDGEIVYGIPKTVTVP